MTNGPYEELRSTTASAVRKAVAELRQTLGSDTLWGFALCTHDEVCSFYHVACTTAWVREREAGYPGIGSLYVEWQQSADENLFNEANRILTSLAGQAQADESRWAEARDERLKTLFLALKDCHDEGLFGQEMLVCMGSTDPCDHLQAVCMHVVEQLNPPAIADRFAHDLGYEHYRSA